MNTLAILKVAATLKLQKAVSEPLHDDTISDAVPEANSAAGKTSRSTWIASVARDATESNHISLTDEQAKRSTWSKSGRTEY